MNHKLSQKNILVTGGAGFVGSHLVEKLLSLNAKVFVLDNNMDQKGYFNSSGLREKVVCINHDLRDYENVYQDVAKNNIEYIYHIGAQALVGEAFLKPLETFQSNIMGTANILEIARTSPFVRGVFVASSDKAYGKDCLDAKEDQKVLGDHPYDASKAATDMLCSTYFKTYGLPVVVARFGNIFGPGDMNFSRIVPGAMQAAIESKELPIRSDGLFRRDYLYVKDVAKGYVKMAEKLDHIKGEAFNFSSGVNLSVLEILDQIQEAIGMPISRRILNDQKNEIPKQSLNFEKAKKMLGWEVKTDLSGPLKETFEWYQKYIK